MSITGPKANRSDKPNSAIVVPTARFTLSRTLHCAHDRNIAAINTISSSQWAVSNSPIMRS